VVGLGIVMHMANLDITHDFVKSNNNLGGWVIKPILYSV